VDYHGIVTHTGKLTADHYLKCLENGEPRQNHMVRIMCFLFSLNSLKCSLMRESNTKMTRDKSWSICKPSTIKLTKRPILPNYQVPNGSFYKKIYKFYHWRIKVCKIDWLFLYQFLLRDKIWVNWEKISNT
jgi:hypothetical protein